MHIQLYTNPQTFSHAVTTRERVRIYKTQKRYASQAIWTQMTIVSLKESMSSPKSLLNQAIS
jgi:hypothetical protein